MKKVIFFIIMFYIGWGLNALYHSSKTYTFQKPHDLYWEVSGYDTQREVDRALCTIQTCGGEGIASYYDYGLPGYPDYSKTHATAATRDWPRGTKLAVCYYYIGQDYFDPNATTERSNCVEVRVNDYGPNGKAHPDRIIDLSSYAFKQLAPLSKGLIKVEVQPLD